MTRTRQMKQTDKQPVVPDVKEAVKPERPLTVEDRIRAKIVALDERQVKTQEEFDAYRQQVNAQLGYFQGTLAEIKEQRDGLRELLIPEGSEPDTSDDGPTENSDDSPPNPASEQPQATAVSSA